MLQIRFTLQFPCLFEEHYHLSNYLHSETQSWLWQISFHSTLCQKLKMSCLSPDIFQIPAQDGSFPCHSEKHLAAFQENCLIPSHCWLWHQIRVSRDYHFFAEESQPYCNKTLKSRLSLQRSLHCLWTSFSTFPNTYADVANIFILLDSDCSSFSMEFKHLVTTWFLTISLTSQAWN